MIETATDVDGLYPGGLLRDRQAKVHALPARSSGRFQFESQEELAALLPSAEGATIGRGGSGATIPAR